MSQVIPSLFPEQKFVVLCYSQPDIPTRYAIVPVDVLLCPDRELLPFQREIPYVCQAVIPTTFSSTYPSLVLLGACPISEFGSSDYKHVYNHCPSAENAMLPFTDMPCDIVNPLTVQVGFCLYVFSMSRKKLVLHKYDIQTDQWAVVPDVDVILNMPGCFPDWFVPNITGAAYVVIGHKLHISLGTSFALALDTRNDTWEHSNLGNLFGSVWTQQNLNCGLLRKLSSHARPFGFRGRGILLLNDVILGFDNDYKQIVAFMLDDDKERVVKGQSIPFNYAPEYSENHTKPLVDLGDSHFGVVYAIDQDMISRLKDDSQIHMVIFKVSELLEPEEDYFLKFDFVREVVLSESFPCFMNDKYTVSCV